jgi:hypothetical protein
MLFNLEPKDRREDLYDFNRELRVFGKSSAHVEARGREGYKEDW